MKYALALALIALCSDFAIACSRPLARIGQRIEARQERRADRVAERVAPRVVAAVVVQRFLGVPVGKCGPMGCTIPKK